jgi:hypothetical protein
MAAFADALEALFADAHLAEEAVYTSAGGSPQLVRVVTRRADEVTGFGEARIWSETTRLDLLVSEVPQPRPGDRIELGGEGFLIQGEPVRDRERLIWTIGLAPAG